MVVVGLHRDRSAGPARLDPQRVGAFGDRGAELAQFCCDGGQTVRLFDSEVGDVDDFHRSGGQRRDRSEGRNEIGAAVAIEAAAAQFAGADHRDHSFLIDDHLASHQGQDVEEPGISLRGGVGQATHPHGAGSGRGGREPVRSRGVIAFHTVFIASQLRRMDRDHVARAAHLGTEGPENVRGDVEVRCRSERGNLQRDSFRHGGAGKHQRRRELARGLRRDGHVKSAPHPLSAQSERRIAFPAGVLHLSSDGHEHVDQIGDGTLVHALLSFQQEASGHERKPAGEKAHSRSRIADEQSYLIGRHRLPLADSQPVLERPGDLEADGAQSLERVARIVRVEAVRDQRGPLGHRCKEESPDRIRLGWRNGDRRVEMSDLRN